METKNRLKEFEIQKKLGFGSYGVIFRVLRRSDKQVLVLKQIDLRNLKEKMRKNAINQAILLSKLKSPFIVQYLQSFIEDNKLNIIMQHCEGGDLSLYLKQQLGRPLKQDKIWEFMLQIILGLEYIHQKRILHRDIKTLNIFLTKEQKVKIGDLGVAKLLNESVDFAQTMVGTPFYLSPELCEQKPYNQKSDIWALGCLIYQMCTYRHPFEAANQGSLILKIIRGKYNPISNYSKQLRDIVDNCLERDYKRRPTAALLLSRVYCQQKIENLGLKVMIDRYALEQQKRKLQNQIKVSSNQVKQNNVEQTPKRQKQKDIQRDIQKDAERKKQEEQKRRKEEEQRKRKQIDLKRRQQQKRIRQQAQRKQQIKRAEERKQQIRRNEEKRRQDEKKEEMRREQMRKQQLKREQLRKQELKIQQIKKDQIKRDMQKEQKRKEVIRKQQLRKQYDRREELKKEQQKKQELRKEQLRKQELKKQQLRKQQAKRIELKKKQELAKLQQLKVTQKLIEKTPVQKVKLQKQVLARVYQKKSVDINKYNSKNKQIPEQKSSNKLFKPLIPTVPTNLIHNLNRESRKSVHSFEQKAPERYAKKQMKKQQVVQSGNLPPRIRKGAPEGKARNAINPKHNISKEDEQMVLDLPDNPKIRFECSDDQMESPTTQKDLKIFKLQKQIDNSNVLKKYEELIDVNTGNIIKHNTEDDNNSSSKHHIDEQNQQKENVDDNLSNSSGHICQQQQNSGEEKQDEEQKYQQKNDQEQNIHEQEPYQDTQEEFNFYSQTNNQEEKLQQVNLWQYDQQPELPQFQKNDEVLMEQQQEIVQQKQTKAHIQIKLESNIRREDQLNKLMQLKVDECKKAFKSNYQQVIQFFRKKINMDSQYNQEDEKEVQQFLKKKNLTNNNKFQNIYKIMHFEMELENCRNIIQGLCMKLNTLSK